MKTFETIDDVLLELAKISLHSKLSIFFSLPTSLFGSGNTIGITSASGGSAYLEKNYVAFSVTYDPQKKNISKCVIEFGGITIEDAKTFAKEYETADYIDTINEIFTPEEIIYEYKEYEPPLTMNEYKIFIKAFKLLMNDKSISEFELYTAKVIYEDTLNVIDKLLSNENKTDAIED